MELERASDYAWTVPRSGDMRVPGVVFASESLMVKAREDRAVDQVANVAHLPGIVGASYAMPDIHWGYGFPIGGVAATDVDDGGVISPGGVGFDICCGVRLLSSHLTGADFVRHGQRIMAELDPRIPRGAGKGGIALRGLLDGVLEHGARAALDAGYGTERDLERCEERGTSAGGRPELVSPEARQRGGGQLGFARRRQSLPRGAGRRSHLRRHRGRGLRAPTRHAHRDDPLREPRSRSSDLPGSAQADGSRDGPARHHGARSSTRLCPDVSREGQAYLGAMATAANFAWANRHILAHEAREAFSVALRTAPADLGLDLVFDVAHNLAKLERHLVAGQPTNLCVHRKGATRAFGPGHADLPDDLREVGQPVLVPGSMGTASWVLRGVADNPAFASAAHGAGRLMSRSAAKRRASGRDVRRDLETAGIAIRPGSVRLLAEEAPYAYKDVDEVARVCEAAGLAARVARLRPIGVVKG